MKNRLQKIITAEGLTPTQFAELIGMQRSSISHILSGRNNPSFDMLQNILAKFTKINPNWLIMGKGDMYQKVIQADLFSESENEGQLKTQSTNSKSIDSRNKEEISEVKPPENPLSEKNVERVIVFYKDKTFTEYLPD
ncbi:MAG TPA: helix-turn-helix domain-containing protein [Perlabentimonas sp.]|nr:helix-turn-helix domain-containing protein [Bacteroidales bacterium]MDY0348494.1 helix-turn-helix domain-containing protein [Tenuifilaceae bacterium]HZJ73224.1 helix-turn-helix domain-containing protein [Perlabentimonas sp.]